MSHTLVKKCGEGVWINMRALVCQYFQRDAETEVKCSGFAVR